MMTAQGMTMAGAGALAELFSPATVMALAGAASIAATAALWPRLTPDRNPAPTTEPHHRPRTDAVS
jgi:hypothetical protein